MSTIKVTNINNASASSGGIALDSSGHVQVDGLQMPTAGALSNRNKIINGDMRIAQRGTSFTGTDKFPADRWIVGGATSVILTSQNESTEVPTGFQNSIKLSITTADTSIAAGDAWNLTQHIEGYNVADLLFGTANAKSVTLSFWVNCTSTGTFCIVLLGSSDGESLDRSYVAEYTINTADTWEQKTITVPGDTGGTWHTGNGRGLSVRFGLTAGTTYQKAAGSWGAGNVIGSSNQTQLLSTANSAWYVTGVQLEVGEKATPFEHRSYGDELQRCQRYWEQSMDPNLQTGSGGMVLAVCCGNVNRAFGHVHFAVPKSKVPTMLYYSSSGAVGKFRNAGQGTDVSVANATSAGTRGANFVISSGIVSVTDQLQGHFTADAEL